MHPDDEVTASEAIGLLNQASPSAVVITESRATAGSSEKQLVDADLPYDKESSDFTQISLKPDETSKLPLSPQRASDPRSTTSKPSLAPQATDLQLSLSPKPGAGHTASLQLSLAPNRGLDHARPQALGSRPKKSHGQGYDDDDDDAIISSDDDINDDDMNMAIMAIMAILR